MNDFEIALQDEVGYLNDTLVGKTIARIDSKIEKDGDTKIVFHFTDNSHYDVPFFEEPEFEEYP
jgi:hypothetical protein